MLNERELRLINRKRINLQLPSRNEFIRFLGWSGGRLLLLTVPLGCDAVMLTAKGFYSLAELLKRSWSNHILKTYDSLPYAYADDGIKSIEAEVVLVEIEPITDLISAIQGKQLMIIGEMGTGKSTIAQYLAYSIGGRIKVVECEGTPEDWQGLDVVGKGENWAEIEAFFQDELSDLSEQMRIRTELGDKALSGTDTTTIVEEYPELVNKVESSSEWLDRHARRGRKARRFKILLSQYDKVAAWGLEGKSDLAEAFFKLRLGKKAIAHAKSLKSEALVNWLKQSKSHALLDDEPLQLPSFQEMRSVLPRLVLGSAVATAHLPGQNTPVTAAPSTGSNLVSSDASMQPPNENSRTAETTLLSGFQPSENTILGVPIGVIQRILSTGKMSKSQVIKDVLGASGDRYLSVQELDRLLSCSQVEGQGGDD